MPYMTTHEQTLWEKWTVHRDEQAGNELIQKYLPLVHYIAERISQTVPKSIPKEELQSLGLMGLYEALEKYDAKRDLKFETYASFRIRGSILDGLRKEDWLPRKTREKAKKMEAVIAKLEQKYLRHVTAEEIAQELNLSVDEVYTTLNESFFANVLSTDEQYTDHGDKESQSFVIKDEKMKSPEDELIYQETIQDIAKAISQLSEKEQLVLSLFYKEELTFTEIGQILNLSTSRISQIHSKAIYQLRKILQKFIPSN